MKLYGRYKGVLRINIVIRKYEFVSNIFMNIDSSVIIYHHIINTFNLIWTVNPFSIFTYICDGTIVRSCIY